MTGTAPERCPAPCTSGSGSRTPAARTPTTPLRTPLSQLLRSTGGTVLAALLALAVTVPLPAQAAPAVAARATLPSDRLHFGISNGPGAPLNWLATSGVPFKYRYQYLSGGIHNGGTAGDPCGGNSGKETENSPPRPFSINYITARAAHPRIPGFTYDEIWHSNTPP